MEKGLKKIVDGLKRYPKVAAIVLFGSHAAGKAKPLSDIDIAVLARDPDKSIEAEIASFSSNVFDVVNFHRLPLYIQFEVLKHSKPLFIRDAKYFSEIKRSVLSEYLEMSHLYGRIGKRALS